MSSINLRPSKVPEYLKISEFYKSLNIESDEEFTIPAEHFKPNTEVTSDADLTILLSTMRFWGLDTFTTSSYDYVIESAKKKPSVWLSDFEDAFPELVTVKQVSGSSQKCMSSVAARAKSTELFKHVYERTGHISSRALLEAATHRSLANLELVYQLLVKSNDGVLKQVSCSTPAANGHLDCLQFLHTHGCNKDKQTCSAAAGSGHLDCLKCGHNQGFSWDTATVKAAIVGGHVACLSYACNNHCPIPRNAVAVAAENGHLECMKYVVEKGCVLNHTVPIAACRKGSAECLQYALERGCKLSSATYTAAVAGGHVDCLQLLNEHHCPLNASTIDVALQGQRWECLKFLVTHSIEGARLCVLSSLQCDSVKGLKVVQECGKPLGDTITTLAMDQSSLRCLHYLHEQNLLQWGAKASIAAILAGSLPLLRFAHEHGCVLAEGCTMTAVCMGELEILKYLHEHGCSLDSASCCEAAKIGHLGCLQYAHEHGAPCTADEVWQEAINSDSLPCLEYLHTQGRIPQSTAPCTAASRIYWLKGLEFLHEHGYPWDIGTCKAAAQNCSLGLNDESFACFTYAAEQGCPWKSVEVARLLATSGRLHYLEYAYEHACPWDETVSTAVQHNSAMLRYCVENGCPISTFSMEVYNLHEVEREAQQAWQAERYTPFPQEDYDDDKEDEIFWCVPVAPTTH